METLDIESQARYLVDEAALSDPSLVKFYWFPHQDEVRLLEISTDTIPSDEVYAIYFPPSPEYGILAPSGVAIIQPKDERVIPPPVGWGSWEQARQLYPRAVP